MVKLNDLLVDKSLHGWARTGVTSFGRQFDILDVIYCKSGNFRESFVFVNSVKRHICGVKISRQGHDLRISVNDSDFGNSRGFYFHMRSFAIIKPSRKIPKFQYRIQHCYVDNRRRNVVFTTTGCSKCT